MRLLLIVALCLLPASGRADTFVADAFGLSQSTDSGERKNWSGARGDNSVTPGLTDRVLIVLGPKSLVAGKDKGHAVVMAFDQHGNLVADGTPATLRIDEKQVVINTRNGIADHVFLPVPQARQILAGATIGDRQSPRAMIRVVPDVGSLHPTLGDTLTDVEPDQFFDVSSEILYDRYGNVVEDGTATGVVLRHEDGTHSIGTAIASHGVARTRFLSRDIVGRAQVRMDLGATSSQPASIELRRATAKETPRVAAVPIPSIGAVRLTVGPFLTSAGHTLVDGAEVKIVLPDETVDLEPTTVWVRDGYVSATIPVKDTGNIGRVSVSSALGDMMLAPDTATGQFQEIME